MAGRNVAVSGPQLTQSVAQQLSYRGDFFPDLGADLKPLGVVGVNRQSGYVGHDFALEYVAVGIHAVQHRSPFCGAGASIQHSVPPSGDIVDP